MTDPAGIGLIGVQTERRISWLTFAFGLLAGILIALFHSRIWGLGVAIGGILAWLNFRWLRRGLNAFVAGSAAQSGLPKAEIPLSSYFLAAFRYVLLGFAIYVIFIYLNVPVLSMLVGLFALGAATVAASLYEIFTPKN
jgi:small-conductance mechanosensitive channel